MIARPCLLAGLTIGALLASSALPGGGAVAAPDPPRPPVSRELAALLAGSPFAAEMVLVHGRDAAAADAAVRASGMRKVTEFEKVGVVVAEASTAEVEDARNHPGVTYLEAPKDIELMTDTSHEATRGAEASVSFRGANGSPLDGTGVSVAVVDSGIDPSHPAFTGGKVVANLECDPLRAAGCLDVGDRPTDELGHGMHVAGVAAGNPRTLADGTRVGGAAPGAKIVSLGISVNNAYVAAMAALNWVLENHAAPCGAGVAADTCPPIRVTNNSYGPPGGGDFDPEEAEAKIQRALVAEGVLTVWAHGNDDGDGTDNRGNPPGQDPTPGVVSVAAHTDHETGVRDDPGRPNLTAFSSRGAIADPATWPDVSAPGAEILSACRLLLPTCLGGGEPRDGGDFVELNGTSFAAPHVAGAAAQLFQLRPGATPGEVEDALKDGAFRFDDDGDSYTRVGGYRTSFDKGAGLVDVVGAVEAARSE
ncbi:MAG: S8 family peptidase [Pseudonocardia sp.]